MAGTKGFEYLSGARAWIAGGAVAGVIAAGVIATLPGGTIDALAWRLWLPYIVEAATPPIGVTGRTLLALASGALVGGAIALVPFVLGALRRGATPRAAAEVPVLRRADAHPDAPARRPIRAAADFGTPLPLKVEPATAPVPDPERPLPADLDLPLAAFDPTALPDVPRAPVRAVPALAPRPALIDPGERFETFVLTPITRGGGRIDTPAPIEEPAVGAVDVAPVIAEAVPPVTAGSSLGSLMERLERAAPRRMSTPAPAPANLDETLGMLRRLATG